MRHKVCKMTWWNWGWEVREAGLKRDLVRKNQKNLYICAFLLAFSISISPPATWLKNSCSTYTRSTRNTVRSYDVIWESSRWLTQVLWLSTDYSKLKRQKPWLEDAPKSNLSTTFTLLGKRPQMPQERQRHKVQARPNRLSISQQCSLWWHSTKSPLASCQTSRQMLPHSRRAILFDSMCVCVQIYTQRHLN